MATQHRTFEAVKYSGSPRISQMPWSGSPACAIAASTIVASPSHTGLTICAAPLRRWMSTASRSMPHTSFWCWSQAPLPTRTGFEFRHPERWSRVDSVRSFRPSIPYMICRSKSPWSPAAASMMKAKYSRASQSNPSR